MINEEVTRQVIAVKKKALHLTAREVVKEDGTLLRRIRLRLFGSGGFFGYLGYFWIVDRGISLCYVAHEGQPVLFIHKPGSKRGIYVNGVKPEQQA